MPPTSSRPELGIHRFTQHFSTDHQYIQQQKSIGNPNYLINPNPPQIFQCNMSPNIIPNVFFPGETSQICNQLDECEEFGLKLGVHYGKATVQLDLLPQYIPRQSSKYFPAWILIVWPWMQLKCCKGIFYMLPIHYQGKLFVRYFYPLFNWSMYPHFKDFKIVYN